jgi:hypothetical protein
MLALQVISWVKPVVLGTFGQVVAAQEYAKRISHAR